MVASQETRLQKAMNKSGLVMGLDCIRIFDTVSEFRDQNVNQIAKILDLPDGRVSTICSDMESRGMISSKKIKSAVGKFGKERLIKHFSPAIRSFAILPRPVKAKVKEAEAVKHSSTTKKIHSPAPFDENNTVPAGNMWLNIFKVENVDDKLQKILDNLKLGEIKQLSEMITKLGLK